MLGFATGIFERARGCLGTFSGHAKSIWAEIEIEIDVRSQGVHIYHNV
jgi:hypothetical protein